MNYIKLIAASCTIMMMVVTCNMASRHECVSIMKKKMSIVKENYEYRRRQCMFLESDACLAQNEKLTKKEMEDLIRDMSILGCKRYIKDLI